MKRKPMRILLLAPTMITGGITTWGRTLQKYSDPDRIEYRVSDTSRTWAKLGQRLGLFRAILGALISAGRILKIVANRFAYRPHVVWFNCAPSLGFVFRDVPLLVLMRMLGVPTIAHLHGGNLSGFYGRGGWHTRIVRIGLASARWVFVITRDMEYRGRKLFGQKVVYVPNMADDELLADCPLKEIRDRSADDPYRLLHVAFQCVEKGSLDVVDAAGRLKSNAYCEMVGDASIHNRDMIQQRIVERGVADRVKLVGVRRGEEMSRTMREADLFVFPTHKEGPEGFPMSILEAMAYGMPIVANEVGNIREMIGYDSADPAGMLLEQVDPVEPAELAAAIDRLCADPELRRRMGAAGQRRVREHYLASRVVPELIEMCEEIAKGREVKNRWSNSK